VLAINVRDPRAIPVTVLVVGSILGWFTTKYLVAARKARDMARAVQVLRDRADDLARGISARHGWQFSNEATSYTLAKIRVTLHKLAALTKSGLPMLVDETELTRLKDDAELRLTKLEALRDVRLQVQLVANNRPTVQRFVGRLLRRASDVLEQTVFGTAQQAAFTARMEELQPWLGGETLLQKYREALALRSESDNVGISVAGVIAPLQDHVKTLLDNWPPPSSLKAADTTIATLQPFDERFEKLALLIREQKASWVQLLADGCAAGNTLNELFRVVDEQFWETLKSLADTIVLRRESAHRTTVDVFVPVEVHLDVPDIDENRILKHPLNVVWTITSPGGTQRVVETENTTLVQYFSQTGTATIRAKLQWGGHEPIEIKHRFELMIAENTGYRWYDLFRQGGAPEIAAVAIAILFAVSTAMQTQYDSTFGSATQYLGLFLWAAGAATGGNVLKQLGTSNTPGGQTEATLPAKT
jgi:hypothetical protein